MRKGKNRKNKESTYIKCEYCGAPVPPEDVMRRWSDWDRQLHAYCPDCYWRIETQEGGAE